MSWVSEAVYGCAPPLEALVTVPGLGNPREGGERNRKKGSGAQEHAACVTRVTGHRRLRLNGSVTFTAASPLVIFDVGRSIGLATDRDIAQVVRRWTIVAAVQLLRAHRHSDD